jgi:hypothetical protein
LQHDVRSGSNEECGFRFDIRRKVETRADNAVGKIFLLQDSGACRPSDPHVSENSDSNNSGGLYALKHLSHRAEARAHIDSQVDFAVSSALQRVDDFLGQLYCLRLIRTKVDFPIAP